MLNMSQFESFSPKEWQQYRADYPLDLTEAELDALRGFNESISISEVAEVYLPLARLLRLHVTSSQTLHNTTCQFLNRHHQKTPYIIGVSGSVAVGKSTTSRLLKTLLERGTPTFKVDVVTTDGFLYPGHLLEKKGLMEKKGFPESYDLKAMIQFLEAVKSGKRNLQVPVYSHESYDILPDESICVDQPDILIIEGLNLLNISSTKQQSSSHRYVSDFLDFAIYVDAKTDTIKQWFLDRFLAFREKAFDCPEKFFHRFTLMNDDDALSYAKSVWHSINEANLVGNILPFKKRANLILSKNKDHKTEAIELRKI